MTLLTRMLLIGVVAGALAFAACGDDDDDESGAGATVSPSPTAGRSPSPTPGEGGTPTALDATGSPEATPTPMPTRAAPTPIPPSLDPGVTKIGEGTLTFVLLPGGQFSIDGLTLVRPGTEAPPCEAFVFAFGWQITEPFPAGGNQVTWRITSQGATEDVGAGAAGSSAVGCGQLTAINNGTDQITVSVHYIVGRF